MKFLPSSSTFFENPVNSQCTHSHTVAAALEQPAGSWFSLYKTLYTQIATGASADNAVVSIGLTLSLFVLSVHFAYFVRHWATASFGFVTVVLIRLAILAIYMYMQTS